MAESKCLALLADNNKPYNVQGVADMLASQGFKKTQVDKALMALAESGKIRCKEFGKTKIFIPIQDGLPELEPEEKENVLAEISQLQQQCKELESSVGAQRNELAVLKSAMSIQELQEQIVARQKELEDVDAKLDKHRASQEEVVSLDDLEATEKIVTKGVQTWESLRRIFRNIWDTVGENIDVNQADVFEEMGVDTDESIGESLSNYQALLPSQKKFKGR